MLLSVLWEYLSKDAECKIWEKDESLLWQGKVKDLPFWLAKDYAVEKDQDGFGSIFIAGEETFEIHVEYCGIKRG